MTQKYDNSGQLFRNDRREKDSHPNMTGSATIDGHDYFVNAWTKEGRNGKFISLSFKAKQPRSEPPQSYAEASGAPDMLADKFLGSRPNLDDDIPFAPEWR